MPKVETLLLLFGSGIVGLIIYIWQDTQSNTTKALSGLSSVVSKLDETLDGLKDTLFGKINKVEAAQVAHKAECDTRCKACPHANPLVEHPPIHNHRRSTD